MKRFSLTLLIVLGCFSSNYVSGQALKENDIVIDTYYGFPNFIFSQFYSQSYSPYGSDPSAGLKRYGPVGVRMEYMISDYYGAGVELGTNYMTLNYDQSEIKYNADTKEYDTTTYTYDFSTTQIGGVVFFKYHLVNNEKLDMTADFGLGFAHRLFTFNSNKPNFFQSKTIGVSPLAFRLGFGMRYFFTENVGMNLSTGLGMGGLINGGLSFKL